MFAIALPPQARNWAASTRIRNSHAKRAFMVLSEEIWVNVTSSRAFFRLGRERQRGGCTPASST